MPRTPTKEELELRMRVGERIARARELRGMTQEDLARESGLPQSTVSKIENGKIKVNLRYIEKVATALAMPAAALVAPGPANQGRTVFPVLNASDSQSMMPPGLREFLDRHEADVTRLEERLLMAHSTQADPRLKYDDVYWSKALQFYREELARASAGGPEGESGKNGGGDPKR